MFKSLHFMLFLSSVVLSCRSENFNRKEELLTKLQPLKLGKTNCTDFCESVSCQKIQECSNGTILKNESYCKCCDICVKYLDDGQPCKELIYGSLALGSQKRCKLGTKCESGICVLDRSVRSCLLNRQNRLDHRSKGNYSDDIWIPQCDTAGKYDGKQKKMRKSICVDELGRRIFGKTEDLLESDCACSRYMLRESENSIRNDKPRERCSPYGTFESLQCIDNLCYCTDSKTGQVRSTLVKIEFLDKLPWHDQKISSKNYLKKCEVELQRTSKISNEFQQKNVKLTGIDNVKCDLDGTFSPIQRLSDRYVCTDKEGMGINSFYKAIREALKVNMTCNCARDEVSTSSFTCLDYGSYSPFSCFNDCVCVDNDGDIISKEFKKEEISDEICEELILNLLKEPIKEPDDETIDYEEYYDL